MSKFEYEVALFKQWCAERGYKPQYASVLKMYLEGVGEA